MSIALDPVILDDLPPYTTGKSIQAPTTIQPDRISAVRIFNNSPFDLLVNNIPGVNQVWLPPYTEDIYVTNVENITSGFNSTPKGIITLTPVNIALRNNDSQTTPIGTYHAYRILVTVYEVGDTIPNGLPIVHNQMVSIVGEALAPTCFVQNVSFNGGSGSIQLSVPDLVAGPATNIIQYATVLAGFSVDLRSSGTQHNNTITITNVAGQATINVDFNIPVTTPWIIYKNNLNWMSANVGSASGGNVITITFPAITGVTGTLTGWAYAERVP